MGTFTLKIEVSLSQETLDVLRQFAPDMPAEICGQPAGPDLKTTVEGYVVDFLGRLKKHAEKPADEPKPETTQSPVPEEKAPQAAPQAPAAAEPAEITDATLRAVTKEAKDRTSANAVRKVFAEFGIGASIECPQERRSDLVAALENLK